VNIALLRGVRTVAVFEAGKGALVLLAGFGLLSLIHRNMQEAAEDLVHHLHLNPAKKYPHIFLDLAGRISDQRLWLLAILAFGYACMRFAEACGLWRGRRWAEWFAVASGGIYVPIEVYELFHGVSPIKLIALLLNAIIVVYMSFTLSLPHGSHGDERS
jgi:uncharacterized membrane protein (DUF2068 family)